MGEKTTFYDLLKESVIAQSLLALVCLVGTFALLLADRPVPEYVWILDASVVSFFFGAKTLFNQRQMASENVRLMAEVAQQNAQILQAVATSGIGGALGGVLSQSETRTRGVEGGVGWTDR